MLLSGKFWIKNNLTRGLTFLATLSTLGVSKSAIHTHGSNMRARRSEGAERVFSLTVSCQQMSRPQSRAQPSRQPASRATRSVGEYLRAARSWTTPSSTNRRALQWRHELNITGIYLGRSRPRIIHSRAPAADGERSEDYGVESGAKCVRSARTAPDTGRCKR